MTTYEEDIVDIYYNLLGYFTIKNIPFPSIEKQVGGKGRGEIDILAVYIQNNEFRNCSHIEVSFSITDRFPHQDSYKKIIKKFFSDGSEKKIRKIIGNTPYAPIIITSDFKRDIKQKLKDGLTKQGAEVLSLAGREKGDSLILELKYKGKTKTIVIQTFTLVFFNLMERFQEEKLLYKNFQDTRLRAIQHLMHLTRKRDDYVKLYAKKEGNLDFL